MFAQTDEERLAAEMQDREATRRSPAERKAHLLKHSFEGVEYMLDKAPRFMRINPATPQITFLMWNSISLLCLSMAWFFCSLFGYILYRTWKTKPLPDETASFNFIFDNQNAPLGAWFVNALISSFMVFQFFIYTIISIWRNVKLVRKRQEKFALEEGWILPENDKRRKSAVSKLCC